MGRISEGKGGQMKSIKINLSRDLDNIQIITVADYHVGNPTCNYDLINKEIEYIKNNDNVYAIVNGDLIENALKTSLGDVYSQKLSPIQQVEKIIEMLRPIKDKILCMTSGNHEFRSYRNDGLDIMRLVARELELEDRYSMGSCLLFLRFGEKIGRAHV